MCLKTKFYAGVRTVPHEVLPFAFHALLAVSLEREAGPGATGKAGAPRGGATPDTTADCAIAEGVCLCSVQPGRAHDEDDKRVRGYSGWAADGVYRGNAERAQRRRARQR